MLTTLETRLYQLPVTVTSLLPVSKSTSPTMTTQSKLSTLKNGATKTTTLMPNFITVTTLTTKICQPTKTDLIRIKLILIMAMINRSMVSLMTGDTPSDTLDVSMKFPISSTGQKLLTSIDTSPIHTTLVIPLRPILMPVMVMMTSVTSTLIWLKFTGFMFSTLISKSVTPMLFVTSQMLTPTLRTNVWRVTEFISLASLWPTLPMRVLDSSTLS